MEYTEQQKQIYNDVCDKYKHNWLNTTISQTMAMEMISKALTIPVVIEPFVCVCPDENWVYDESGVDMYCKKCSGEEAN